MHNQSTKINGITYNLTHKDIVVHNGDVYVNNPSKLPGIILNWAHWCGHCTHFKSTYVDICTKLNGNGIVRYPCIAIESEELKKIPNVLESLDIKGYPTIKFFDQSGKIIGDFTGKRDKSVILSTICDVFHQCVKRA
jgi:thiol-disulfide isomerase/thioredoxin